MTLILACKDQNFHSIISDMRVTHGTSGQNSAVKTGLLFRGCIFGRAGNERAGRRFITEFRETIHGERNTIDGFWQSFSSFADKYPLAQHGSFKLILSVRLSSGPAFYLLDSNEGLHSLERDDNDAWLGAIGSGARLLSKEKSSKKLSAYLRDFVPRLKKNKEKFLKLKEKEGIDHKYFRFKYIRPFLICLWLTELSRGYEASMLEREAGVGGVFHYIHQDFQTEMPQWPSVYILGDADCQNKIIYGEMYRVVPVEGGIYIERHKPPELQGNTGNVEKGIYFNSVSRPGVQFVDQDTLLSQVKNSLKDKPYFYFCGFGFSDPNQRKSYGWIVSSEGTKDKIFDESGALQPIWERRIIQNFEMGW